MNRESSTVPGAVVVVLDGDTEAGHLLARRLLEQGCRVAAIARRPAGAVAIMHGQSADRVMVIAADVTDRRQWSQVADRVTGRFGRIDTVVRAGAAALLASA